MLLHTTQNQIEVYVEPGSKSAGDFVVKYREPHQRVRTPKHRALLKIGRRGVAPVLGF